MQNLSAITGLAVFSLLAGCSVFTPTLDEAGIVEIEINPGEKPPIVEPPGDEKFTIHDVAVIRKRLPKKRGREAYFVARVASDALRGTRITVKYSDNKHENPM